MGNEARIYKQGWREMPGPALFFVSPKCHFLGVTKITVCKQKIPFLKQTTFLFISDFIMAHDILEALKAHAAQRMLHCHWLTHKRTAEAHDRKQKPTTDSNSCGQAADNSALRTHPFLSFDAWNKAMAKVADLGSLGILLGTRAQGFTLGHFQSRVY